MSVYAVVPVKNPSEGKSRLSRLLTPEARRRLTILMFEDVVTALKRAELLTGVIVVSPSPIVLNLGKRLDCRIVEEKPGGVGLNKALELAVEFAADLGAEAVLMVPADIPLLEPEDVNSMILAGLTLEKPYVVASPSRNGGTNALMFSLPTPIAFRFGIGSFRLHVSEALEAGSTLLIYQSDRISLDLDGEEDVKLFLSKEACRKSWRYLKSILG